MSQLVPFLTEDPLPPSRNGRSPLRWVVAALGVVALVVATVWVIGTVRGLAPEQGVSVVPGLPVTVVVDSGDSLGTLAANLAEVGVVGSATSFLATAELDERATRIGPGVYALTTGMDGHARPGIPGGAVGAPRGTASGRNLAHHVRSHADPPGGSGNRGGGFRPTGTSRMEQWASRGLYVSRVV